jgi:hypothetical protein
VEVEVLASARESQVWGRVRFRHDGERECVVDCSALAALRGSIELASGKPVASRVTLQLVARERMFPGRRRDLAVPPGRLTVEIVTAAGRLATRDVEVRPYETVRVRF